MSPESHLPEVQERHDRMRARLDPKVPAEQREVEARGPETCWCIPRAEDVLEVRVRGKGDKEASKHSVDVGVLFGDLGRKPRGRIKMRCVETPAQQCKWKENGAPGRPATNKGVVECHKANEEGKPPARLRRRKG